MVVWRHSQDVIHQFKTGAECGCCSQRVPVGKVWTFPAIWYRRSSLYDCLFLFLILSAKREQGAVSHPAGLYPRSHYSGYAGKTPARVRTGYPYRNGYLCGEHSGLSCGPGERYHRAVLETLPPLHMTKKNRRCRRFHPDQKPGLFYVVKENHL